MEIVDIGNKLKELRKLSGLTQKAVASAIDVNFTKIVDWERGKVVPNADEFMELCNLYEVYDIMATFTVDTTIPQVEHSIKVELPKFNLKGQAKILNYMEDIGSVPEYKKGINIKVNA